ncbi:MAG TPA: PAAR domain-containing protein [Candidatus Nanopelagicales bacterium]|nr:PAAR domain-containing protein [Candidatus Nanopelagicales bacterium]
MPPASRISDNHTCPHVGGPLVTGEPTVLIGFMPASRKGDKLTCQAPPDVVAKGERTVLIGDEQAARIGDPTVHGGVIVQGCPTVIIGSDSAVECLKSAALEAKAFVNKVDP